MSAQRIHRVGLIVRVVVTIDAVEHVRRDSEEAADLVHRNPELRLPRDRRVSQRVGHHIRPQTSCLPDGPECLVDPPNRLTVPLNHRAQGQSAPMPAA